MTTSKLTVKEELEKLYKYRIEMHAHTTPASECSEITPEKMAEIYSNLGYDAIVLTNHYIYGYGCFENNDIDTGVNLYLKNYYDTVHCCEKAGITVLLGAEIRFTENVNDYLIYGLDETMLKDIYNLLPYGVENFRKNYKMDNSVFLQAHPFRDGMTTINPEILDGIETLNLHQGCNSRIAIATRYAKQNNIMITSAGSDFHHLGRGHEGSAALRTKILPHDSFELARIMKSGDYIFEIGGSSIVLP